MFDLFMFLQVIAPAVSGGWQTLALFGVLALQGWSMYLNQQRNIETQQKIKSVGDTTELVHKSVNSQLDAFKKEAAEQYKVALEQGIAVVRLTLEKAADAKVSALESRISTLEGKLDSERAKAVVLAAGSAKSIDATVKLEPAARLEEIRGQTGGK